jgi:hypothetical protein
VILGAPGVDLVGTWERANDGWWLFDALAGARIIP